LFCVHIFDNVSSTQDIALDFPPFSIIVASSQTKGRGTNQKEWQSQKGNLFSTFVFPSDYDPFEINTLFLKTLKKIFSTWIPSDQITVKTPNDILINQKKISGILIEVHPQKILVGLGINLIYHPVVNQPTICLLDLNVQKNMHQILFDFTKSLDF
jgi:biotin-[acetyl-CoA-carboxylase] ligase BirA-like protein